MKQGRKEIFKAYTERQKELAPIGKRIAWPLLLPKKIGVNKLCPCGSGKKFKKCCGK